MGSFCGRLTENQNVLKDEAYKIVLNDLYHTL